MIDQNQRSKIQTCLYFNNEEEVKDFLDYVKDDYGKVIKWIEKHPHVYKQSESANAVHSLLHNSNASNAIKSFDYYPGDPLYNGPNSANFCQDYMGLVNSLCVYMQWLPNQYDGVITNVQSFYKGWALGIAYQHISGYGSKSGDMISFNITFRLGLSLFWGDIGTFYWYAPESHNGDYNITTKQGHIYQ